MCAALLNANTSGSGLNRCFGLFFGELASVAGLLLNRFDKPLLKNNLVQITIGNTENDSEGNFVV